MSTIDFLFIFLFSQKKVACDFHVIEKAPNCKKTVNYLCFLLILSHLHVLLFLLILFCMLKKLK